jgi:hypothetical protein
MFQRFITVTILLKILNIGMNDDVKHADMLQGVNSRYSVKDRKHKEF